jgi:hypothetical protein
MPRSLIASAVLEMEGVSPIPKMEETTDIYQITPRHNLKIINFIVTAVRVPYLTKKSAREFIRLLTDRRTNAQFLTEFIPRYIMRGCMLLWDIFSYLVTCSK